MSKFDAFCESPFNGFIESPFNVRGCEGDQPIFVGGQDFTPGTGRDLRRYTDDGTGLTETHIATSNVRIECICTDDDNVYMTPRTTAGAGSQIRAYTREDLTLVWQFKGSGFGGAAVCSERNDHAYISGGNRVQKILKSDGSTVWTFTTPDVNELIGSTYTSQQPLWVDEDDVGWLGISLEAGHPTDANSWGILKLDVDGNEDARFVVSDDKDPSVVQRITGGDLIIGFQDVVAGYNLARYTIGGAKVWDNSASSPTLDVFDFVIIGNLIVTAQAPLCFGQPDVIGVYGGSGDNVYRQDFDGQGATDRTAYVPATGAKTTITNTTVVFNEDPGSHGRTITSIRTTKRTVDTTGL